MDDLVKPNTDDETVSTASSLKTADVHQEIERRLSEHPAELAKVTGMEGDVVRDPKMSFGQSSLTFKDVSFSIKLRDGSRKQILAPTSGHFEPGTLVALMGPSGCGKTTLLDILAGTKTSPHEGTIHVNGRPRDGLWPRISTYVPQSDIMPATWTVKEAVLFNSRLKGNMPQKLNEHFRNEFVDMMLKDLGLYEVRDTMIGDGRMRGISGGQKRRVTLARGFAGRGQIVFADEPTSGLSATDAEACVKVMRLRAKKMGVTTIVVIHQPRIEVAKLFDHLMLFTSGPGRCVYSGSMAAAIPYWEAVGYPVPQFANPTDHFLDMVTPGAPGNQVDTFVQYFDKHQKPSTEAIVNTNLNNQGLSALDMLQGLHQQYEKTLGKLPPVNKSKYARSFRHQLMYVFRRKLTLDLRDKRGILTEYVMSLFKAIIMGIGFTGIGNEPAQLQLAFVYMLILAVAMSGMQKMPKLVEERTVMKLETSDALYTELAYIISVALINTSFALGANLVFISVMFAFAGMDWAIFGPFVMWATLGFVCFDSIFSLVAAIAKDSQSAQATAIPFLLLFVMYNGFSITKAACPSFMQWALHISPAAYSIEAIAIACEELSTGEAHDQWTRVNVLYQFEDNRYTALAVMGTLVVACRLGQFICLQKLNKIAR